MRCGSRRAYRLALRTAQIRRAEGPPIRSPRGTGPSADRPGSATPRRSRCRHRPHADPRAGRRPNESGDATRVRARDDLRRHSRTANDDAAGEAHVDTIRGEIGLRPIYAERELADRIGPEGSGTLKAPGLAFDLHDRVVRPRDDAVESRSHRPAIDDRCDIEVAIDG